MLGYHISCWRASHQLLAPALRMGFISGAITSWLYSTLRDGVYTSGGSISGGSPTAGWFMENPRINWMMTRGTSFSGNLHVNIDDVPPGQSMNFASWKDLFQLLLGLRWEHTIPTCVVVYCYTDPKFTVDPVPKIPFFVGWLSILGYVFGVKYVFFWFPI